MSTSRHRSLILCILLALPLCASAATREGNGWRIRKWAKETTAECGDIVYYILEVTRTGPGPVDAIIVDGMDSYAQEAYLAAYPANDGGGRGFILWARTMNQGDTFSAVYAVQLKTPLPVGTVVRNWALAQTDPYDPDQHLSIDHELMIGGGNKTRGANRCTGEGGDPVNTATGEFFLSPMTDFDLGGPLPLRFTRWYASQMNDPGLDMVESALGLGWMHNYEVQTFYWAGFISRFVLTEEGKLVPFVPLFGAEEGWALNFEQEPVPYELKDDGKSLWFLDPERERLYRFGTNHWSFAKEVVDRNGNSLQINRRPDMLVTNVTDGLGRRLDFEYTAAGNLLRVTDGTRSVGFAYDAQGTVIAFTNTLGHVTAYTYDPAHSHTNLQGALMTGVQHPLGNTPYTQAYNADGQVVSQTDAYGSTSTFSYHSPTTGMTQVSGPQGAFVHTHQNYRRATGLADQDGNASEIDYDLVHDLPVGVTDRRGHATAFTYDMSQRLLTNVVHRNGETTTFHYVPTDQVFTNREDTARTVTFTFQDLHTTKHPDGSTETFHRDGRGNVTRYVDRAGEEWMTIYNERGQPLTVTRPDGGVQTFTYHADGTLASRTDSDSGVTTFAYDALRRRTRETRPDGGVTAMAYDTADRIIAITNAYGGAVHFQHDPNNLRTQVTDPAGYVITRQYDLMNRITNRFDSIGHLVTVTYDTMSRPILETGPAGTNHYFYDARGWVTNHTRAGRSWSWTYDPEGYVQEILSPLGHRISYQRDSMGRITNAVGPLMESRTTAYDRMGRRVRVTDPNLHATRFAYDEAGRLVAVTNALGAAASIEYNPAGLITRATGFDGHAVSFGHTPMGRLASITNALDEVTRYSYDTAGRVARIDFPDGTHETRTYNPAGRVRTRTDRGTNTWSYGYDPRGDLVAVTNPVGGVTAYTYRLDGLPETAADTDRGPVTNRYDAARRLVETSLPDGVSMQYEYNAHEEIMAVTDANGSRTEYIHDTDGRLLSETDADGLALHFTYDASGRITNLIDRAGQPTRFEYDAGGRRTATVDATGMRIEYGFNALDRMTSATRGDRTWTRTYDDAGFLTAHTTPMDRTTTFLRDAAGRSIGQVDPLGRTNLVTRDAMGRIAAITDPAGRERTFGYDARGLLVSAGGTGQVPARFERDALGNVTRITDPNTNDWTFTFSPMGAWTGQTDPLGRTLTFTRNARGQIIGATHPDLVAQSLHYDPSGNLTGTVYTTGLTLGYAYDVHRRVVAADGITLERDPEGRITNTVSTADGRAFGAAYDAAGRLTAATYDGAFTVTYTYDPVHGLLDTVSDSLSGATIAYVYDADGRVTGITRGNGRHVTYTYDPASRITRIQDGTLVDVQFEYDAAGRLTAEEGTYPLNAADGLVHETPAFEYDQAAQVSSPGYAYDPRGRRTAAPGHAYAWDAASRLVAADGVALTYDGFDETVTRTEDGITRRYYYNRALIPASIVSERNETAGQFVRHYVWSPGGQLLYAIDVASGHQPRYYHFDRNGSTLALTDENGDLTDAYAYTPFGRIIRQQGTSNQPFTFIGQYGIRQQDADGALYQMRARYYDAHTGRFLSPDPIGPGISHPQKLNPYQYAGNQPLGRIDRDGLDWWGPDRDPLPRDADLVTMPDFELDRIEGLLNAENRTESINMPAARKRLDRIRAERMRRNPGRVQAPPDPVAPEHTDCEQNPLNRASQPPGDKQVDTVPWPNDPFFPQRPGDLLADIMGWEFRRLLEQKMAAELLREKERTMYAPQHRPDGLQNPLGCPDAGMPQRPGDLLADAMGREFRRLLEQKMAAELLREKERTLYSPQVHRDGIWQPVGRLGGEEAVAPPKKRFEIKDEWMRPPPPPPPEDFPDPLAVVLDRMFGPEALMNFVRQQQAEQQALQRAQAEASNPAPAPQQKRLLYSQLTANRDAAQRKAADLMKAGDYAGARKALDDARHWDKEIKIRDSTDPFGLFRH